MGTDAILIKDGKEVAFLGRLHQFTKEFTNHMDELDTDYDVLEERIEKMNQSLLSKIEKLVFFVAGRRDFADFEGNWEEFTRGEMYDILLEDVTGEIEYHAEEMRNIGKKLLLGLMLEDEKLSLRMDY